MSYRKWSIFGIVVVALCTGAALSIFWKQRMKPWNEQALRAEFFISATSGDMQAKICLYTVLNTTDKDYSLTTSSAITLMRWSQLTESLNGPVTSVTVQLPWFIPPGQKQEIKIIVPISETYLPDRYKSYARTDKEALYRVPTHSGFVLFDGDHRYKTNFPPCGHEKMVE